LRWIANSIAVVAILGAFLVWNSQPDHEPLPTPATEARRQATFLAVGDIMLSRGVAHAMDIKNDSQAPFRSMANVFRSTDFNFGNLETPFSGNDARVGKGLIFNARLRDIAGLRENNFKILSFANNHALDQGVKGLQNTLEHLRSNGLQPVGAGMNLDEAWRPATIVANGIKFGFVATSYASYNDGGVDRNEYVARMEDRERLRLAIERLRAEKVDFIVASMHSGTEYKRTPDKPAVDFAKAAIDYGADIVIGGHPHWIQTFEVYRGRYIFYSLGNFIFDQSWSTDTQEGLALKITVESPEGTSFARASRIELMPVIIEDRSTPRLANEAETRRIFAKFGATDRVIVPQK
jgi:poly-gamma-glutamate synthesis protein (capsule biosynthesis protein)